MKERTPIDPDLKNFFELQVLKQLFEDNFFAFVDGKPGRLSPVELAERAFNIAHIQGYTDFTAEHRSQLIEALEQIVVTYADICKKWSVLKYKFVDVKFSILGGWRQYRIFNDGITGNVLKITAEVRMNSGRTALEMYNEDVVKATVYLIDRMNYNYRTDQLQEWNIQNNLIVWKDLIQGNGFLNFILTKDRTGVVPMRVVVSTQTRPLIKPLPPPPTPVPWPWPQPGPFPGPTPVPMPHPPGPPVQPGFGPVPGPMPPAPGPNPYPPNPWHGPVPGPWGRDGGKVKEGEDKPAAPREGTSDDSAFNMKPSDEPTSWPAPWPDPHYPVPGPAPDQPGPQPFPDPYGPPVPGPQPTPIFPPPPMPTPPPAPVPFWPPPPPPPPVIADCALTRTVVAERTVGGIKKGDVLPAGLTYTVFVEWLLRGTDPLPEDEDPIITLAEQHSYDDVSGQLTCTITSLGTAQPSVIRFYMQPLEVNEDSTISGVAARDRINLDEPIYLGKRDYEEGQTVYTLPCEEWSTLDNKLPKNPPYVRVKYFAIMSYVSKYTQTDGNVRSNEEYYTPPAPIPPSVQDYIFSAAVPLIDPDTGNKFIPTGDQIAGYSVIEFDEDMLRSSIRVEFPCQRNTAVIAVPEDMLNKIAWFESDGATPLTLPTTAAGRGGRDYTVTINNRAYKVYLWDTKYYGTQSVILKHQ